MPAKTAKTLGNKKSDDDRRSAQQSSRRGQGTCTDPLVIGNSRADETETALRPDEEDPAHQTKDGPCQSFNPRDTSTASGHRSQLLVTDEETRTAAETLKML